MVGDLKISPDGKATFESDFDFKKVDELASCIKNIFYDISLCERDQKTSELKKTQILIGNKYEITAVVLGDGSIEAQVKAA